MGYYVYNSITDTVGICIDHSTYTARAPPPSVLRPPVDQGYKVRKGS